MAGVQQSAGCCRSKVVVTARPSQQAQLPPWLSVAAAGRAIPASPRPQRRHASLPPAARTKTKTDLWRRCSAEVLVRQARVVRVTRLGKPPQPPPLLWPTLLQYNVAASCGRNLQIMLQFHSHKHEFGKIYFWLFFGTNKYMIRMIKFGQCHCKISYKIIFAIMPSQLVVWPMQCEFHWQEEWPAVRAL